MGDNRETILDNSTKIISRLQLLSVFFEDELVYKIYVRTQVIHKLFGNNPELDIHKLELFHIQFTETIVELLRKIKKSNEKNIVLTEEEIHVNEELMAKISNSMRLEENYLHAQKAQAVAVNQSLFKLYQNLSNISAEQPFHKSIRQFSHLFSKDFFSGIDSIKADQLISFDAAKVYRNGYGTIEKNLMGLQCKHEFKNRFHCGLKSGSILLEVYRLVAQEEYFIFYAEKNLFLHLTPDELEGIDLSGGISKNAKIIQDLTVKNSLLKNGMPAMKTSIPDNIRQLLNDYHTRIAGMDFFDFIDDFDVQANILKTMLNTESI